MTGCTGRVEKVNEIEDKTKAPGGLNSMDGPRNPAASSPRPSMTSKFLRYLPLTSEGLIWIIAVLALLVTGLLKGINLITLLSHPKDVLTLSPSD